jgi:predicted Rossmann fold nucleotide-binding protein DprA/Smf involved in DNA uptake
VRDLDDVLTALALARGGRPIVSSHDGAVSGRSPDQRPEGLDRAERAVWESVDDTPTTVESVLLRTGLAVATVATAVEARVARGLLVEGAGWWSRT